MIVVDTQVLLYAALPYDASSVAMSVRRVDSAWVAPLLWRSEFTNVLAGYIRRLALTRSEAEAAFGHAAALLVDETEPDVSAVLALVEASSCTAYDLEVVAVAQSLGVSLVTNDRQILESFPSVAVSLESFAARSA